MTTSKKTPWAVICTEHGQMFLTEQEYHCQMDRPDSLWRCPKCGASSYWDDDNFEEFCNQEDEEPIKDINDCMLADALIEFLVDNGYRNVWLEDTDAGLVIHGVSVGRGDGGRAGSIEYIVPEGWNNK